MRMKRLTRQLHGWIGAFAALFVLLVALSGASLAFMSQLFLAQYGEVLRADVAQAPADLDRLFAAALATEPGFRAMGVLMPHTRVPDVGTAMVFGMPTNAAGREDPLMISLDPGTAEVKGKFWLGDAIGHEVIDFHWQLLAGDIGATFVAVLGLLLALFALSGLWLWWPRKGHVLRKSVHLRLRNRRIGAAMFSLHGWLGVWTATLILLFALSGTAVARPDWLGGALRDRDAFAPTAAVWQRQCSGSVSPGQAARALAAAYPDRRLTTLYFGAPGEPYALAMRKASDLNRMEGDLVAWVHPTCPGLVHSVDLGEQSLAAKADSIMFSLHGGYSFGPIIGRLLVLVAGLALAALTVSGMITFLARRTRMPDQTVQTPGPLGTQPAE